MHLVKLKYSNDVEIPSSGLYDLSKMDAPKLWYIDYNGTSGSASYNVRIFACGEETDIRHFFVKNTPGSHQYGNLVTIIGIQGFYQKSDGTILLPLKYNGSLSTTGGATAYSSITFSSGSESSKIDIPNSNSIMLISPFFYNITTASNIM